MATAHQRQSTCPGSSWSCAACSVGEGWCDSSLYYSPSTKCKSGSNRNWPLFWATWVSEFTQPRTSSWRLRTQWDFLRLLLPRERQPHSNPSLGIGLWDFKRCRHSLLCSGCASGHKGSGDLPTLREEASPSLYTSLREEGSPRLFSPGRRCGHLLASSIYVCYSRSRFYSFFSPPWSSKGPVATWVSSCVAGPQEKRGRRHRPSLKPRRLCITFLLIFNGRKFHYLNRTAQMKFLGAEFTKDLWNLEKIHKRF